MVSIQDDIFIIGRDDDYYIKNLDSVFNCLDSYGL